MTRSLKKNKKGYTFVELLIVVAIIAILSSILQPSFDLTLIRARQSKAKANLGNLRSAINLYYSAHEGIWPFSNYPPGMTHYTTDGLSLSAVLEPKYMTEIPQPILYDRLGSFNGLATSWDESVKANFALTPTKDVIIILGNADYTPMLNCPYAFDNKTGTLYIPNGNYDASYKYFYDW